MFRKIQPTYWIIALLFLGACGTVDEQIVQETAVNEYETVTPMLTSTVRSIDKTETATKPATTATLLPTSTAQPTATVIPPTPTEDLSATNAPSTISPQDQQSESDGDQEELTY